MSSQLTLLLRPRLGVGSARGLDRGGFIARHGRSGRSTHRSAAFRRARGRSGAGRSLAPAGRSFDRRQEATHQLVDPVRPRSPRRRRSRASRRSGSVPSCPSSQWPPSAPSSVVTRRVTPISVKRRRYPRVGGPASLMGDLSRRPQCSSRRESPLAERPNGGELSEDDPGVDVDAAVADRLDLQRVRAQGLEVPAEDDLSMLRRVARTVSDLDQRAVDVDVRPDRRSGSSTTTQATSRPVNVNSTVRLGSVAQRAAPPE